MAGDDWIDDAGGNDAGGNDAGGNDASGDNDRGDNNGGNARRWLDADVRGVALTGTSRPAQGEPIVAQPDSPSTQPNSSRSLIVASPSTNWFNAIGAHALDRAGKARQRAALQVLPRLAGQGIKA